MIKFDSCFDNFEQQFEDRFNFQTEITADPKENIACFGFIKNTFSFVTISSRKFVNIYFYDCLNEWRKQISIYLEGPGYCFDFCLENKTLYIGSNSGRCINSFVNLQIGEGNLLENKRVHSRYSKIVDIKILEKRRLIVTLGTDKMLICKSMNGDTYLFKENLSLGKLYQFQVSEQENMCVVPLYNSICFIEMKFDERGATTHKYYPDINISTMMMSPSSEILAVGHNNGIIRLFYTNNLDNHRVYGLFGIKNKILKLQFCGDVDLIALSADNLITIWDISQKRYSISELAYANLNASIGFFQYLIQYIARWFGGDFTFCYICGLRLSNHTEYEFFCYLSYGFEEMTMVCIPCQKKSKIKEVKCMKSLYVTDKPTNFAFDACSKHIVLSLKSRDLKIFKQNPDLEE